MYTVSISYHIPKHLINLIISLLNKIDIYTVHRNTLYSSVNTRYIYKHTHKSLYLSEIYVHVYGSLNMHEQHTYQIQTVSTVNIIVYIILCV